MKRRLMLLLLVYQAFKVESCAVPSLAFGVESSVPDDDAFSLNRLFSSLKEITFAMDNGNGKEKSVCKLVCEQGKWTGPLCRNERTQEYEAYRPSCVLNYRPPHMLIEFNRSLLELESRQTFEHGSVLYFRCDEPSPGMHFAMEGNATVVCRNGQWEKRIPRCRKVSARENFSMELSPQLRVSTSGNGSLATWHVGRSGELIVYPGSIVHLDCVFNRRIGDPKWRWATARMYAGFNSSLPIRRKRYPTGWTRTSESVSDNWLFRVSIIYAKVGEDTKRFTCRNPAGKSNSILLLVSDDECQALHNDQDSMLNTRLDFGLKLGSTAHFECPQGFEIQGEHKARCLQDGVWSAETPKCRPLVCEPLEMLDARLRIVRLNNTFAGEAVFACPFGYALVGAHELRCGADAKWSHPVPECRAIECAWPPSPLNGVVINLDGSDNVSHVGDSVKFACNEGFLLVGQPLITCNPFGLWSHSTPFCKRACRFPGDPGNGRVVPLKFLYEVGDEVSVLCASGFVNPGAKRMRCLHTGFWSHPLKNCLSYLT